MECYGLSLRIPAYNGIVHYFIALYGHKQFYVMLGTALLFLISLLCGSFSFSLKLDFVRKACEGFHSIFVTLNQLFLVGGQVVGTQVAFLTLPVVPIESDSGL